MLEKNTAANKKDIHAINIISISRSNKRPISPHVILSEFLLEDHQWQDEAYKNQPEHHIQDGAKNKKETDHVI